SIEIEFALDNLFQSSWWVGAANPTVNYVGGAIDDVRIYADALEEDEIAELYEEPVEVECPAQGDTRCETLEIDGPADGTAGDYTVTATAADDSGDDVLFTFTAANGAGTVITAGPQPEATAVLSLTAGTWTITVSSDDDALCDDELPGSECSSMIVVGEAPAMLVARWAFDGDLTDASGDNDGIFFGEEEPFFVEGQDGVPEGAISLDGLDDYVQVLDAPELRLRDRFTLALWFQSARTDQFQKYLFSRNDSIPGGSGKQYAIIFEYTEDRVDFYAPSRLSGTDPRAGGMSLMPLEDTDWHHIAYTYDGATWSGYIDGVQVFSSQIQFALDDTFASSWWIGAANPNVNHVEGAIDDARIYNYALSAAEIAALVGEVAPCPEVGDTHVTALEVDGPDPEPGLYDVTATASDDSGDPIIYTFRATRGG
ncbi:MAG: LamG domain-containing protein, partial [Actinobacteria bacterium]|nr:LamG domain-containing protein [Actinomycetota bacterium]